MPACLKRSVRRQAALLVFSAAAGFAQTNQVLHVEFNLFAGRPRPKAEITDAGESKAILDSLSARTAVAVPCSEIPPMPSTPLYTGTLLQFSVPIVQRTTLVVRNGYIYYDIDLPCYRDPGSNLEKLAVATAFQYQDMNAPGGPKSMDYLSCMVPDSLHANSEPCATAIRPLPGNRNLSGAADSRIRILFGLDGRAREVESPVFLLGRPPRAEREVR